MDDITKTIYSFSHRSEKYDFLQRIIYLHIILQYVIQIPDLAQLNC
jgi:hypothetical protein